MSLSIIIPIYFSRLELYQIIDRCIKSIQTNYPDIEIILIDDASPIDTSDWLITYRNKINKGYTASVNKGLKLATGDILIICNDDITVKKGDLDRFYAIRDGIYSPKTTDEGSGDLFGSLWGMNRKTFQKIGYLDEKYPHYFSDKAYYNKAKRLKISIIKWEDILVEHIGKATYKGMENDRDMERNIAAGL